MGAAPQASLPLLICLKRHEIIGARNPCSFLIRVDRKFQAIKRNGLVPKEFPPEEQLNVANYCN